MNREERVQVMEKVKVVLKGVNLKDEQKFFLDLSLVLQESTLKANKPKTLKTIKKGDTIWHRDYGFAEIQEIEEMKNDRKITVEFASDTWPFEETFNQDGKEYRSSLTPSIFAEEMIMVPKNV